MDSSICIVLPLLVASGARKTMNLKRSVMLISLLLSKQISVTSGLMDAAIIRSLAFRYAVNAFLRQSGNSHRTEWTKTKKE
ncbi:hypothetical protein [Paraburkholderia sediminicola]|uniref:hypothetical protein n=1 Tax=Paraburkholderia sediminicola TaxID=458836 RepID=UPI0038B76E8A